MYLTSQNWIDCDCQIQLANGPWCKIWINTKIRGNEKLKLYRDGVALNEQDICMWWVMFAGKIGAWDLHSYEIIAIIFKRVYIWWSKWVKRVTRGMYLDIVVEKKGKSSARVRSCYKIFVEASRLIFPYLQLRPRW